jgi:hypothetical protein
MRAETLFFWHSNPAATRIPDAHFITEARYRGTKVITVTPDYSPSAVHASLWVNPHPASDAALALGLARGILERGAVDEAYVREQTDLPFLVDEETGRFLRQSDLEEGGADDVFYVFDLATGEIAEAPGTAGQWGDSLELGELVPALEGRFEVTTPRAVIRARPMLERLRVRLAEYTPERVEELTGVGRGTQARLIEELANSSRILFYPSWGSNKSYHADLLHRSLILISTLRGQQGKPGSGVRFAAWLDFSGSSDLTSAEGPSWLQRLILRFYTPPPRAIENAIAGVSRDGITFTPSHLFLNMHGGLDRIEDPDSDDPELGRPAREYLHEAIERGWLRVRPPRDTPPRVLVTSGVNPLPTCCCPRPATTRSAASSTPSRSRPTSWPETRPWSRWARPRASGRSCRSWQCGSRSALASAASRESWPRSTSGSASTASTDPETIRRSWSGSSPAPRSRAGRAGRRRSAPEPCP